MFSKQVSALAAALLITKVKVTSCQEDSVPQVDSIALYLSPQSRQQMKDYLKGVGRDCDPERIVIKRLQNPNDSFEYEPLFGERAAFRLKGIVDTKDGRSAGFGRVAIMSGELKDLHYEASLVLSKGAAESPEQLVESMDLPSRLHDAKLGDKHFWQGRLPGATVLGTKYPPTPGSIVRFSFERQLVVDGKLCSSLHVGPEGECTFDRSIVVATRMLEEEKANEAVNASRAVDQEAVASEGDGSTPSTSNDKKECPVCKFMKSGPCKDEFEAWDKCVDGLKEEDDISNCLQPTMAMMVCMRGHEYYDLMTAGTADKMAAIEAAKTATAQNDAHNDSTGK